MAKLLPVTQSMPKIKHYYLAQLAAALNGSIQRALDHLVVSHKILKNYHKKESPTYADI